MRKFTFILAMLLSFAGLAKAQDAENTYDPTTAEGVVPALSTVDGTKFAYYLRSYADASKFLTPYMDEPTTQNKKGLITTNVDEATLVAIVKNGNAFDMYSVNKEGTLVAKWRGNKPFLWINTLTGSAYTTFAIKNVSADDVAYTISNGNQYLNTTNASEQYMSGGNATQATSQWQFIPANDAAKAAAALTIKVAEGDAVHGNLATFSASYPTAKPEGYTVYTATKNAANNEVELTELTGNVIPASTGVLLKGDANNAVAITPSLETATATSELVATNEDTKTVADGESIYALGVDGGQLAFCKVKANTTIGANKAYLPADAAGALKLSFDGTVTAINHAVVAEKSDAPIFDLSGRRVTKANKAGLYIQNGKKFIVK